MTNFLEFMIRGALTRQNNGSANDALLLFIIISNGPELVLDCPRLYDIVVVKMVRDMSR